MIKRLVKVNLPSEYQLLDYIEGVDSAILSNTIPNGNFKMVVDAQATSSYFGFGINEEYRFHISQFADYFHFGYSLAWINTIPFDYERHILTLDSKGICTVDKQEFQIGTEIGTDLNVFTSPISIMGQTNNAVPLCNCKLYSMKIYKDEVLYNDFVPCKRKSDNVVGVYDLVQGAFFSKTYGNEPLGGNNVNDIKEIKAIKRIHTLLPKEYQQVEYLESTGTQWIDTNYIPNSNTSIKLSFQITKSQVAGIIGSGEEWNTVDNFIFGPAYGDCFWGYAGGANNIRLWQGNYNFTDTYNVYMDVTKFIVESNNVEYTAITNKTEIINPTRSIHIFKANTANDTLKNGSSIKLFKTEIYENNILIQNYIPCYRKSDNVAGMYDLVSGEFFTNAATGSFIVGDDKQNIVDITKINKVINGEVKTIYI